MFHFKSKSKAAGEGARSTLSHAKEFFHLLQVGGPAIRRQTFHEHFSVLLLQNAVVQQHQQSAIMERADQAPEALFQRDHRRRHLVLEEGIAAVGVDRS